MAIVKLTEAQKRVLAFIVKTNGDGFCLNYHEYPTAEALQRKGLITNLLTDYVEVGFKLACCDITPAGLAYLYQGDQMVDQPAERRCTINIAEAHQMIADAQALNAKIAAEAAAIRNSK